MNRISRWFAAIAGWWRHKYLEFICNRLCTVDRRDGCSISEHLSPAVICVIVPPRRNRLAADRSCGGWREVGVVGSQPLPSVVVSVCSRTDIFAFISGAVSPSYVPDIAGDGCFVGAHSRPSRRVFGAVFPRSRRARSQFAAWPILFPVGLGFPPRYHCVTTQSLCSGSAMADVSVTVWRHPPVAVAVAVVWFPAAPSPPQLPRPKRSRWSLIRINRLSTNRSTNSVMILVIKEPSSTLQHVKALFPVVRWVWV